MLWVKIAESEKMPKNIHENILTQYSTAYRTMILTVFETKFKALIQMFIAV